MASSSQRRQCIALAFIVMLGVAEARRVQVKVAQGAHSKVTSEPANKHAVVVWEPRDDLTKEIDSANTAINKVQDGEGWWGTKYCLISCPGLWIEVIYHQWRMRSAGYAVISESFGTGRPLTALIDADPVEEKPLATAFHGVMRKICWTFLKTIDQSIVQRTLLTLLMAPLGLFRTATGMSPLGLCFFKASWKDIHDYDPEKYKQQSTTWWSVMLSGCPDTPPNDAFEEEAHTVSILDSMVSALAAPEGLDHDEDAKWEGAATYKACVDKMTSTGSWQKRELSIEKGIITWRATSDCDAEWWGHTRYAFGHTKSFAMQFLTTESGSDADLVQLFTRTTDEDTPTQQSCMKMQNAHRKFQFCANPGSDIAEAKRVIDAHIKLLGSEKALLVTASKVDRLVAAATLVDDGGEKGAHNEQQLLMAGDDKTGDTSTQSLELGEVSEDMLGQEGIQARKILNQVKTANSLISTGQDVHNGTALLQEAFAAAHLNQHLSKIMSSKTSQKSSRELSTGLGAGASAGTITTTELLIILIVCGGGLFCLGLLAILAKNSLEEVSERIEPYKDLHRNATKLVLPHGPHA